MPAPRIVKNLIDMEIDEISVVDRGANQHSSVVIAKRAPEEDHMPDLYLEDGTPLTDDNATEGLTVYDEDNNQYSLEAEDAEGAAAEEPQPERELETAGVAKSAFGKRQAGTVEKSFSVQVMEDISKALTDDERDTILSKALTDLEAQNTEAHQIAKSEKDLRLTREYIAKADEYGLPVAADELGPVLYRMAESMSYEDCSVIAKCLETAGALQDQIFEEIGKQGGGANSDVMAMVDGYAGELVEKSDGEADFSKAEYVAGIFDQTPEAYDQYRADQRANARY